jgi:RNA polymerase sigma factor (sigma-70 family)
MPTAVPSGDDPAAPRRGGSDEIRQTIDAIWGIESAKVIARVARMVGDIGLAEDLAQDALVAALERWPATGVPDNPGAWLTATAKHKAIDLLRRRERLERRTGDLAHEATVAVAPTVEDEADTEDVGDDLLRLMFIACHPVLSRDARVALTLRMVGGLQTDEIARAFLVPEPTLAQRIVRAKRTLRAAEVPFELPPRDELGARLASVLEVIYLVFNEGYSATAGDDLLRPELCNEALRLGRLLASLAPDEPEAHGLVALMEIQASRAGARTTPDGHPVLLSDQDRGLWNPAQIRRGLAALDRASAAGGPRGPYALQAAIAACHARARTADATDWPEIAALYDALAQIRPSPVIELNRAVALGMAFGPAAGLEVADGLVDEPALRAYHLLPAVRADLLDRLGRTDEARREFERAASLTRNGRERAVLLGRAAQCASAATRPAIGDPSPPG